MQLFVIGFTHVSNNAMGWNNQVTHVQHVLSFFATTNASKKGTNGQVLIL